MKNAFPSFTEPSYKKNVWNMAHLQVQEFLIYLWDILKYLIRCFPKRFIS